MNIFLNLREKDQQKVFFIMILNNIEVRTESIMKFVMEKITFDKEVLHHHKRESFLTKKENTVNSILHVMNKIMKLSIIPLIKSIQIQN